MQVGVAAAARQGLMPVDAATTTPLAAHDRPPWHVGGALEARLSHLSLPADTGRFLKRLRQKRLASHQA